MNCFAAAKRIVVKVGTSTLAYETGLINIRRLELLVKVLSDLKNSGREIVLVTSGAIGVGAGKLGLRSKPADMPTKQAAAAVGQSELMYLYDRIFGRYGHPTGQVLLTKDIVGDGERRENVINTIDRMLHLGAIPIVNENDTVSVEEIEFGDNDTLSAIVAELIRADVLVIMSDIDGLFDKNPHLHPGASLLPRVETIDSDIRRIAAGTASSLGTGGMITKIHAAEIATAAGVDMAIISGINPYNLYKLFDGEPLGTHFVAQRHNAAKREENGV